MKNNFPIISFLILCSCNYSNKDKDRALIQFNEEGALKKQINYSENFSGFKIIPLENNHESFMEYISNVIPIHDKLVVNNDQKVLLFSQNGDFIRQIGNKGKGPSEYIYVQHVNIDNEGKHILVFDGSLNRIFKFNFQGELIKFYKMPNQIRIKSFKYTSKGNFLLELNPYSPGKSPVIVEMDSTGKITRKYLENRAIPTAMYYSNLSFYSNKDDISFFNSYLPSIYKIKNGSIINFIRINSESELDIEEFSAYEKKIASGNVLDENGIVTMYKGKGSYGITNYWENKNYITFIYQKSNGRIYSVIYDKVKEEISSGFFKDDISGAITYSNLFGGENGVLIKNCNFSDFPKLINGLNNLIDNNSLCLNGNTVKEKVNQLTEYDDHVLILYK